jgi:hypothetical protein
MHFLAYIDPGVGSLIWQAIVGIFVGLLFYMRRTRKWIGGLMHKVFGIGKSSSNSADVKTPQEAPRPSKRDS